MFWHFLFHFGRSLRANKALCLINVFSLAVGLAGFAIAFLYVQRELSYDQGWPNAERIHRLVVERKGVPGSPDSVSPRVGPRGHQALLSYFSEQIESATRLISTPVRVGETDRGGDNFLTFVDPAFADIFPLEVLEGSLARVLSHPGFIALSETRAQALGDEGRVGQRLLMQSPHARGEQEFEVGAIVRLPGRTAQHIDMLAVISDFSEALFVVPSSIPWEGPTPLRVLLKPGVDAQELNDQMPLFVERSLSGSIDGVSAGSISEHLFYELQPIREIYLNPRGFEEDGLAFGNKAKVVTFFAVGLLVLLVGCTNSASISFANALHRRREIGIRKASGATKQNIVLHYLGESVLLALISCLLAFALLSLLLAPVLTLLNVTGELSPGMAERGLLLVIAVFIGLINGLYPAFVLSGLRPQLVFESHVRASNKGPFSARVLLVGGQFCLTVIFMASAFALYAQLAVAQAQPLGYDHRNLLYFSYQRSSSAPNASLVANSVQDLPGVEVATPLVTVPPNMDLPLNINAANLVSKQEREVEVQATRLMITDGFPEMLGIPLLAGRALDASRDGWASSADRSGTVEHALINRRAADALGFADPEKAVDQTIYMRRPDESGNQVETPLLIVGVLEDSRYSSVHRRPVPEFYALPAEIDIAQFMLRYEPTVANDIQQSVAALLKPYGVKLNFLFIEDRIEAAYFQERSESRLLLIGAGMALLLSCVGMYGLVAATMTRSMKEMGIRKVMGATFASLLALFLWRFSRPVLLASLIAWPLAGWFVLGWIQRFPYQIDLGWLPPLFLSASLLVLLVAWLAIGAVTARAAQWPPTESLRYE